MNGFPCVAVRSSVDVYAGGAGDIIEGGPEVAVWSREGVEGTGKAIFKCFKAIYNLA
jgi:hypothetical protein